MAINWIESEITEHTRWTDVLASLKFKGDTWQAVDPKRAMDFMQKAKNYRKS